MADRIGMIRQDLTILTPTAQDVLPVPLAEWNKLQERIAETKGTTARLDTLGWAALGAAISFLSVVITLPFSLEWSKVVNNVEYVNWPAVATEAIVGFLSFAFLGLGVLSLYWAGVKQKMQAKMGEWLVEDMKSFAARHNKTVRA